ncbi:MAG: acetate kinase [Clostridiales bacterium]|nr:acetate kinase [Clostridiales bacterium]MCD8215153.1 acetate kinase [Clostridiales bacterium]
MKILVLNCGSSSLKYQLIDMDTTDVLAVGLCERIGIDGRLKHEPEGKPEYVSESPLPDHDVAVKAVMDALLDKDHGVIADISEIGGVGHRVVHGGESFSESVIITPEVKAAIEDCCSLAPLHNPANLIGINACEKLMPGVPQVAVFDTAFHQTMPAKAYMYALPYELYEKHKIRRYGFHGTSHKYVSLKCAELMGKAPEDVKIITCHLGNGGSLAAVDKGKVVDTTMGLTPLAGIIMGTRCGDIDPAIVKFLMDAENLSAAEVDSLMNKQSGVLGLSGVSSDFRDLGDAAEKGNKRARIALDAFHYRVAKFIGEYLVALNGADAIVFTAGLGENSGSSRQAICDYLTFLGIKLDPEKNSQRGKAQCISTEDSPIKVYVIPTNEELMIAQDTNKLING